MDFSEESCSSFSLSVNYMVFNFTSKQKFSHYMEKLNTLQSIILDTSGIPPHCERSTGLFVCNLIFVPCNLTTGTPRPLCSRTCSNFYRFCTDQYNVIANIARILEFPILQNCKNTLHHLNAGYGYPNSSSEFEDDCFESMFN